MAQSVAWFLFALSIVIPIAAQESSSAAPLDPGGDPSRLVRPVHVLLAEQYIWTAGDAATLRPDHAKFIYRDRDRKTEPHAFRGWFTLRSSRSAATLYIAGPRSVKAWINGELVLDAACDPQSPLATHVYRANAGSALRIGRNLIAIEAVRGRGVVAASDSPIVQQLAYGETVAAKIVPAAPGLATPPIAISNSSWRSVVSPSGNWQSADFDDDAWPPVQSLGAIESSPDFFQWNTDAGMYDWPNYMGLSPELRTFILRPASITHAHGDLHNPDALTSTSPRDPFTVWFAQGAAPDANALDSNVPGLLVDFGREVAGRLFVESGCDCEAQILVIYGESEGEALSGANYLGVNLLRVTPHGTVRGPKSGFRYAWLRFTAGAPQTAFRFIGAEGIAYPVRYLGSFESSDPKLNRIWQTAAYTAHLCMQDGIWDAPKRDRGRWAGDLDVTAPVIGDVFGDRTLLDTTLTRLIPPSGQHVNGIPGYSALWITTLADLYQRSGDKTLLAAKHEALLRLLAQIDSEFDANGHFTNKDHRWLFVDWAPDLFAYSPEATEGTEFEFIRGLSTGAWLLDQLGDGVNGARYKSRADALASTARSQFADAAGTFGSLWQLNAMAVLSGVAQAGDDSAIWARVFSGVGDASHEQTISPYFNFYLLDALARMNRRRQALDWLRTYWGGMIDEGATSFWEAYDLRWPKENPHLGLQADGTSGYFVSLAHGWSSGPAAWLMEEILGVKSTAPGFRRVEIRPDLAGLDWIRGAVPTPRGLVRVDASARRVAVTLPLGTTASVLLPAGKWTLDGATVSTEIAEDGSRVRALLHTAGRFEFRER
jgi:hypothetical protein